MKKSILLSIVLFTINLSCFSQKNDNLKFIVKDTMLFYSILNTDTFKQIDTDSYVFYNNKYHCREDKQKIKKRLYWNNNSIDSSGLSFSYLPICINKKFFCAVSKNFYLFGEKENLIKKSRLLNILFETPYAYYLAIGANYRYDKIIKYNPETGDSTFICDMGKYCKYPEYGYNTGICDIKMFGKHNLLITICSGTAGASDFTYYSCNTKTGKIIPLNHYRELEKDPSNAEYFFTIKIYISDPSENYFYGYMKSKQIVSPDDFIFDNKLKIIGNALGKYKDIKENNVFEQLAGYNYTDYKVTSVNIRSILDKIDKRTGKEEKVIIPYRFTVPFETSMYKVYYDTLLTSKTLNKLNKRELSTIKNLIFAKHNYKFDSEYYQAFFNLFTFYNNKEKRTARTKDVNNLLTEADKQNLKIIIEELRIRN